MKNDRNFVTAVLCFAMLYGTGCSSNSIFSEAPSASETVQTASATESAEAAEETPENVPDIKASDGNMFQTMRFSFSVGDNVKYETHEDNVYDNLSDKRSFEFTCDDAGIELISVNDSTATNCTPEFYMKKNEGVLAFDENGWQLSKNGDNDIASFCTSFNDKTGTCEAVADVMCQGMRLEIFAVCKPESLENAKKIVNEIAQSAEYTGSYHFPTGDQSYDGKYFSAKCDLPWELLASEHKNREEAEFSLLGIDDYQKYVVSLSVTAFSDTAAKYAGAAEFADDIYNNYNSKKKSDSLKNVTNGKEKLKGFDAYTVEYDEINTDYTEHSKYWFFDHDDLIFELKGSWCKDDQEYEAEVMKLIDAIEIK